MSEPQQSETPRRGRETRARGRLAGDAEVIRRFLDHIDARTSDRGARTWREPVANYRSRERLAAEQGLLRRLPVPFCPSAALAEPGSWQAAHMAGTSLLAVRGNDGKARVFRNACRHRGAELVSGEGCGKGFVCRYHGWAYGLDGSLRNVPHADGFPGLDMATRGLVEVASQESQGIVFVNQEGRASFEDGLAEIADVLPSDYVLRGVERLEVPANWKILAESFLEGYHIRTTHPETFFPLQYDNLNVVETFGPHRRLAFPFRSIEKMRDLPDEERSAERTMTFVYHLFPNALLATFPGRVFLVTMDPVAVDRTLQTTWSLVENAGTDEAVEDYLAQAADLVSRGNAEDREVVQSIQRGLAGDANEFFEFGLYESAVVHFHEVLATALAGRRASS
jgi:phenylpropionate dioxygenase-like ring-hydroxylating dioxygenase large terminal subunit